MPSTGNFLKNCAAVRRRRPRGAFAFIPISIAAARRFQSISRTRVAALDTSQQARRSDRIAIASSVAASHTNALLTSATPHPRRSPDGFQQAFLVLGVIALLALRRSSRSSAAMSLRRRDQDNDPRATAPLSPPRTNAHQSAQL